MTVPHTPDLIVHRLGQQELPNFVRGAIEAKRLFLHFTVRQDRFGNLIPQAFDIGQPAPRL